MSAEPASWAELKRRIKKVRLRARKLLDQVEMRRVFQPELVVAIGASAGGPGAIRKILENLSVPEKVSVVVVQHPFAGFEQEMMRLLDGVGGFKVGMARGGEPLMVGTVRIAPAGYHLKVRSHRLVLDKKTPPIWGFKPSADVLFGSLAVNMPGRIFAVLLSGLGKDGALGLKAVKNAGGIAVVQSPDSCFAPGMPTAASQMMAADIVLPPEEIGAFASSVAADAGGPDGW